MRLKEWQDKKWDCLTIAFLLLLPHLLYSFMFQTPPGNDFSVYQPQALLRFFSYLQAGCFPLWSPLLYGGMSAHFEHALSQSFSPITWCYALFPGTWNGNLIQVMLHFKLFLLGCGGMWAYLFFYRISQQRVASLFGALTFMFNFRMLDNLRYATPLEILVILPLLLLLIEGWLQEKSSWRYWLYPLVLGVMLLSGHPQHSLYNLILISIYFLSRLFFLATKLPPLEKNSWVQRIQLKKLFAFAGMNLLGVMIAAPLLLPFQTEVIPQLYRRILEDPARGDLHKMNFSSLVMSFLFPWFADVHSNFYSHISLCFFLFIGIRIVFNYLETSQEQRFFLIFFLSFFGFALLYALGSSTYVSTLVSYLIPPLKSARVHGRILGTGIFCLAGVVVFVLQWILQQTNSAKKIDILPYRKFGIYFIGGGSLGILTLFLVGIGIAWTHNFFDIQTFSPEKLFYFLGAYFTYFIFQSDSPAFIHADPKMFPWQILSFICFSSVTLLSFYFLLSREPSKRRNAFILLFLLFLCEIRFYHTRGTWFDSAFPKQLSTEQFLAWDTFHQRFYPEMEYQSPIVQETSQFYLTTQVADFNAPKNIALFLLSGNAPALTLFENLTQGKLFVSQQYSIVTDMQLALAQNKENLRNRCILEKEEALKLPWKELFPQLQEIVPGDYWCPEIQAGFQMLSYTPNGIIFRMKMEAPGIVNFLDASHPGFIATVDGVLVDCIRTYGAFKGVWVPRGIHEVSIQYHPKSFFVALKLVWLALVWIGIGSLLSFLKQTRFSKKALWMALFLLFSLFLGRNVEQRLLDRIRNPVFIQYRP